MNIRSRSASVLAVLAGAAACTLGTPHPASAAWPPFGRAISTATGDQALAAITADGAGGAIIAWVDFRDSTANVYAGHVLASGEIDAAWPLNGRALRTNPLALAGEPDDPSLPVLVSDGAGGAIVAWQDGRSAVTQTDIYAQHVLASGVVDPAWPANGRALSVAPNLQDDAEIASDGAGGAIVTWMDGRDLGTSHSVDVYAQHVLASGLVDSRWPVNGLAVSTADGPQEFPVLVDDGAGGAIITWYDLQFGPTGFDIYAQRVLSSGVVDPAWPVNGRALCSNVSDQFSPRITTDGAHGAIVAWDDNRNASFHPFAQHVLVTGVVDPRWPVDGLAISGAGIQEDFPKLVPDGAGGAIVTWQRRTDVINIFAHHLLPAGVVDPAWPATGRALAPGTPTQTGAAIVPDGSGGAIVAWQDNFDDIFAQHVQASSALDPSYPAAGRAICSLPSAQSTPALVATGAGGAIATWSDDRNGAGVDVFALQVLDAATTDVAVPGPPGLAFRRPGPNPARGGTVLRFSLPSEAGVRLAIYDVSGRRVRDLVSGPEPAGEHAIGWDLRDERGESVGAGIFFARLEVGGRTLSQKLISLK